MLDVPAGVRGLVVAALLPLCLWGCERLSEDDAKSPDVPGVLRVSFLADQLLAEYAANSLVFAQDRVAQRVVALGRVDLLAPDGSAVFRTGERSDLLCFAEGPAGSALLEEGMWVLLRGRIGGVAGSRVWLERCEFREFHWVSD